MASRNAGKLLTNSLFFNSFLMWKNFHSSSYIAQLGDTSQYWIFKNIFCSRSVRHSLTINLKLFNWLDVNVIVITGNLVRIEDSIDK